MAVKAGDRIRLIAMTDDPNAIPSGETGTVLDVNYVECLNFTQITVDWDGPYSLMLSSPPDLFTVISKATQD